MTLSSVTWLASARVPSNMRKSNEELDEKRPPKSAGDETTAAEPAESRFDKPPDFEGQLCTNDEPPSAETLQEIRDYVVQDASGGKHHFHTLYDGEEVAQRILVIFVRHFFCGACMEYLQYLSNAISIDEIKKLRPSVSIVVVGCGDPRLINGYKYTTNFPFPIYTDPSGSLFDRLGMKKTILIGSKPAYITKSLAVLLADGALLAAQHLSSGLAFKSGNLFQSGGEFLFDVDDSGGRLTEKQSWGGESDGENEAGGGRGQGKRVTWCHRMRTVRDHSEAAEIMYQMSKAP